MEENKVFWKGNDSSLMECLESYGFVYKHEGDEFKGYTANGMDEERGVPNSFIPFYLDHDTIDEYFEENGESIAAMCGVTPEEMDYEWKMDALLSYYGTYEFESSYCLSLTTDEVIDIVKDDWFGTLD